ncbi:MAG: hypothetical protein Q7S33_05570 [Nanoarchaeota archaeon]|nr:hypothetical protein [Nanoarchaeota archaeon]
MENNYSEEDGMKESKEYVSVSTRLPLNDVVLLKLYCNKNQIAPSEYIRDLVLKNLKSPRKQFLSGKSKIIYNKSTNSFSWLVQLDSGQEVEVLNNLSDKFIRNLKQEIDQAIQEKNEWVHQTKSDSVDVPRELVGGKE